MNEIEIKVKIDDKNDIIKELKKRNCHFSNEKHQIDTIFLNKNIEDFDIKPGMIVLRTRTIGDKHLITLKQRGDKSLESKEIEFGVSDCHLCKELIKTLGYKEMVTVDKKRITTQYKEYNICIDEVKDLGSFIEIEILTDEQGKASYYEQKMLALCLELGINPDNRIDSHYDTMIYNLKKNA